MKNPGAILSAMILGLFLTSAATAAESESDYRVLSTSRTSTMEKELNQAAASGYRFVEVTNAPNVLGGKELVVVTVKDSRSTGAEPRRYKVVSARGTSDMQKKLRTAAIDGYRYLSQTTMPNVFGGTDVVVILEQQEQEE